METLPIDDAFQYQDPVFPPNHSSLFTLDQLGQKGKARKADSDILWVRIPNVFSAYSLSLCGESGESGIRVVLEEDSLSADHVALAFNSIKSSPSLLLRMF